MPGMEFEPTTPVFEQAKMIHASDLAATVMADNLLQHTKSLDSAYRVYLYVS
jgi:hypothetical protein